MFFYLSIIVFFGFISKNVKFIIWKNYNVINKEYNYIEFKKIFLNYNMFEILNFIILYNLFFY